jgi:hypothetical protein
MASDAREMGGVFVRVGVKVNVGERVPVGVLVSVVVGVKVAVGDPGVGVSVEKGSQVEVQVGVEKGL